MTSHYIVLVHFNVSFVTVKRTQYFRAICVDDVIIYCLYICKTPDDTNETG